MSLSGDFKLQWHEHDTNLVNLTRDLCGQSELTDVTMTCAGGISFSAHRLVLAGASGYFRSMFQGMPVWKHPVIFLKEVTATQMEYFLQFIYFGEVNVPAKELDAIILVAKELGIRGLDTVPDGQFNNQLGEKKSSDFSKSKRTSVQIGPSLIKKIRIKEEDVDKEENQDYRNDDEEETQNDEPGEDFGDDSEHNMEGDDFEEEEEEPATSVKQEKTPRIVKGFVGEGDNVIEMIESKKGKPKIIMNGYQYVKKKEGVNSWSWRCSKTTCNASVVTDVHGLQGDVLIGHTHHPDKNAVERSKQLLRLKRLVSVNLDKDTSTLANMFFADISHEVRQMLGKRESYLKNIKRYKANFKAKMVESDPDNVAQP